LPFALCLRVICGYSSGHLLPPAVLNSIVLIFMKKSDLFRELVTTYQNHGWVLKSALLQPYTHAELRVNQAIELESIPVKESPVDALWFSRPSHQNRQAWELRLLSETQYALFENFEPDETEEQRDEMRLEMEARLRDYVTGHR
jgi:hypothetical protein